MFSLYLNDDKLSDCLREEIGLHINNIRKDIDNLENLLLSKKQTSIIFRDKSKLHFYNIKDEIMIKENHLKELNKTYEPVLSRNESIFTIITGNHNTGKKTTVNKFAMDLRTHEEYHNRSIESVQVNCRQRKTEYSLMLRIIRHFQPSFPDRGFSIDEMLNNLDNHLNKKNVHLIIVLEEADIFIDKNGLDLLYKFIPSKQNQSLFNNKISLILISNKSLTDYFDNEMLDQFINLNVIEFNPLTFDEVKNILNQVVSDSFKEGSVDSKVIDSIVNITAKEGDIRLGIQLLLKAGLSADSEGRDLVTLNDVKDLFPQTI